LRLTEKRSWKSFDSYKTCVNRMWILKFNIANWRISTCSCPVFLKDFICKHVVGIAIINKVFDVRPEAKTVPIGT
jgi:SWIM zinc finger